MISKNEFKAVKRFQEERNRLFHKGGLWFHDAPLATKEKLAEMAIEAVRVMDALEARAQQPPPNANWTPIKPGSPLGRS